VVAVVIVKRRGRGKEKLTQAKANALLPSVDLSAASSLVPPSKRSAAEAATAAEAAAAAAVAAAIIRKREEGREEAKSEFHEFSAFFFHFNLEIQGGRKE
jgi:flagellar biosynthesis/type III secretory pathway protein FliH